MEENTPNSDFEELHSSDYTKIIIFFSISILIIFGLIFYFTKKNTHARSKDVEIIYDVNTSQENNEEIKEEIIIKEEVIEEETIIEEKIEQEDTKEEVVQKSSNHNSNKIIDSNPNTHISMSIIDEGYNLYCPPKSKAGYRYGPSIIRNEDGTLDAWFSSPGNNSSEWDWITYKHSEDGISWENEKIVLQPTGDTMDHYSVCDPAVIYFNGYYYIGYSSTTVSTNNGINNNIFVARSKNPDGPYEKWDGYGWGGKPKPIIYYNESSDAWGAGEISFVIKDGYLYCYYTWNCEHGRFTKLSIATLNENWPSELQYQGIVIENNLGQDSFDVVYLEEYDKFLAFSIVERMTNNSGIIIYESQDGFNFKKSDIIRSNTCMHAHNMGITKKENGHISKDDELAIVYAYSNSSTTVGKWATRYQPIELIIYQDNEYRSYDEGGVATNRGNYLSNNNNSYISGISAGKKYINIGVNDSSAISLYAYDQNRVSSQITQGVTYEYDDSVFDIIDNKVFPKAEGESIVYAYYKDFYTTFLVKVINSTRKEIVTFDPVEKVLDFYLNNVNYHSKQIRTYIEFENGTWGEAYNDYTSHHPKYPARLDGDEYHLTYTVLDASICTVDEYGIVTPKKAGKTQIIVSVNDAISCTVDVIVYQ